MCKLHFLFYYYKLGLLSRHICKHKTEQLSLDPDASYVVPTIDVDAPTIKNPVCMDLLFHGNL